MHDSRKNTGRLVWILMWLQGIAFDADAVVLFTQLRIEAVDGGEPPRRSAKMATVVVKVMRNKHTPRFVNESYSATVKQNRGAGHRVLTLLARDLDKVTFMFLSVSYCLTQQQYVVIVKMYTYPT